MQSLNVRQILTTLLPKACAWVEESERHILAEGSPLTVAQIADARLIGVQSPDRVRILRVARIPGPTDQELVAAASMAGLQFTHTAGMALRYGIYLATGLSDERSTLVHELTHTAQYERLGGIMPFLRQYIEECLAVGYDRCSLEQEAVAAARRVVGS